MQNYISITLILVKSFYEVIEVFCVFFVSSEVCIELFPPIEGRVGAFFVL